MENYYSTRSLLNFFRSQHEERCGRTVGGREGTITIEILDNILRRVIDSFIHSFHNILLQRTHSCISPPAVAAAVAAVVFLRRLRNGPIVFGGGRGKGDVAEGVSIGVDEGDEVLAVEEPVVVVAVGGGPDEGVVVEELLGGSFVVVLFFVEEGGDARLVDDAVVAGVEESEDEAEGVVPFFGVVAVEEGEADEEGEEVDGAGVLGEESEEGLHRAAIEELLRSRDHR
mmetsp:Transcript_482/g.1727  ORF Transcript_482/g.1727 Transcript_482/m.1727 type:complete len:228 (-) Transcript_482:1377-2060(-)